MSLTVYNLDRAHEKENSLDPQGGNRNVQNVEVQYGSTTTDKEYNEEYLTLDEVRCMVQKEVVVLLKE